ncbi:MAG: type VI secretion system tip protein VgrG [Rubrivivax sp.]|nr:type VI secretion system tip protein VgrG [Rubrivivax sp.]
MTRSLDIETPLGPGAFVLVAFSGQEGLSTLSRFNITLKCKRHDIDAARMLGQNVTVRVEVGKRKTRHFNGYITRWSGVNEVRDTQVGGKQTKAYLYEATVSPWLWFLTRSANSRIFQDKTVPEIVEEVFQCHGALAGFKMQLSGSYREWDYCVQYRETDFNFVNRLLEQEGIYYFVDHANGKHTLTLVDSVSAHKPFPGYEEIRFDEEDREDGEQFDQWQSTHEIQPGRYVTADYNYLKPRTLIEDTAEKKLSHPYAAFEFYDYPSEVGNPAEAKQAAAVRLDELQTQYHSFSAGGNVRGLQPGCSFKLDKHPVASFNDKHLVVSASYQSSGNADSSGGGSGFEFRCSISAIPLKQQYRPPRLTPKPLVQGPQTAVVVGKAGEEIDTDDEGLGRIKVQFRWDRYGKADENSSCWIRVAQPWAGNGYGALAIPRLGQEVIVEFLEGDPDWPIVTGSVYNGENKPPYKLPDEKTRWGLKSRSSKGGGAANLNELRFEDKKGSEEVYVHAEKDLNFYTKKKRTEFVGDESHLQVEKDVLRKLGADVHTDIKGDEVTKLGGGVHLTVGEDWQAKVGTKMAANVGQEIHLKAGATVVIEAGTQISLKVGGNFITINSGGVFIKGTMVMVNSGGAAGSGSGASPKTPKAAKKAPETKGGTDKPISQKAAALKAARSSATPFCEICNG